MELYTHIITDHSVSNTITINVTWLPDNKITELHLGSSLVGRIMVLLVLDYL